MHLKSKLVLAGVALAGLSACGTTDSASYRDWRRPWELSAWATSRSDGLVELRAVTVAPIPAMRPAKSALPHRASPAR